MESMPVPAPVADETNVDSPGESLAAGRYLVYGHLGQGSQAETFRAVDKKLGKAVAVKRFRVGHAKAWKDVWSAGQGVGDIDDIPSAAELCQRLITEYREAIAGLNSGRIREEHSGSASDFAAPR